MSPISNDHELRLALDALSADQQRVLGARFVHNVMNLCGDSRVLLAVTTGMNPAASAAECEEAFRAARTFAVTSYTECGKDTDWLAQAAHFVGAAAAASLTPPDAAGTGNAWKAAMQARMARNCVMIAQDDGGDHEEAHRQYQIANDYLAGSL